MYCLKCGREMVEDHAFCSDCLSIMEQYPVKPGTAVQLPKRREGSPAQRSVARRKTLTPEEQIRRLRKGSRNLFVLWVVTFLLLCAMCIPGIAHLLEGKEFVLGQNYSVFVPTESNEQ